MILGPFTPPVVTLLGLTRIGYGEMILFVAGPIALITLTATWLMLQRIQRRTKEINPYRHLEGVERFVPTRQSKRATNTFTALFLAAVIYGIIAKAATSYVIVVMLGLAFALLNPNFFVAYLISIACFGLFEAIYMANACAAWDSLVL